MIQHAHVGDVGTDILLNVRKDVSTASSLKILITRPDGSDVLRSAQPYNVTYVRYQTEAEDFTIPGWYKLQPKVVSQYEDQVHSGDVFNLEVLE